jgi:hypothetical protein
VLYRFFDLQQIILAVHVWSPGRPELSIRVQIKRSESTHSTVDETAYACDPNAYHLFVISSAICLSRQVSSVESCDWSFFAAECGRFV